MYQAMKKTYLKLGLILVLGFVLSIVQGQNVYYYYVQFTDKNNNPYSLSHPEQFLTQRAIDRRLAYNIPIVENDLPVTPEYLQGVAAKGVTLLNPTKWFNGVTVETADTNLVDSIQTLSYVQSVRELKTGSAAKEAFFKNESFSKIPEGQFKSTSSVQIYDYGNAYLQINQLNGIPLHEAGYRGQGMVIAVLDGGFLDVQQQVVFDSLRAEGRILGTKDFVHPGSSVYTDSDHGRMVLSCMAADDPGVMIGTAPRASFWLLHTEDVPTESVLEEYNWVSGAEYADSVGADIINSSLGYTAFDNTSDSYTYADLNGKTAVSTRGAEITASKGILVVNSAGNSGSDSNFPWVGAPADGDSVFTIGAVTSDGSRVSFSSIGPTSDGRIKPTVMALGYYATVANATNGVLFGNGTSFSSPIMAGMSACLWQAHPQASNMQIIQAIKETASLHDNPNDQMGWGIPDFAKADSILTIMTGITQNSMSDKKWKVFPNPFKDYFTLKLSGSKQSGKLKLGVYNLLGQKVSEKDFEISNTSDIIEVKSLSRLPKGVYVIAVTLGSIHFQTKILKQ